jgi:two-component system, NtrC family, response regulator HydG
MTFPHATRTPKRVLILDDDLATRASLSEWLQGAGYSCTAASSFEEASALLHSRHVDLLITDIRLGEHNGLQLVYRHAGDIAAIVITGFDDPALAAEVRALGAIYLLKPVNLTALDGHLRTMLTRPASSAL